MFRQPGKYNTEEKKRQFVKRGVPRGIANLPLEGRKQLERIIECLINRPAKYPVMIWYLEQISDDIKFNLDDVNRVEEAIKHHQSEPCVLEALEQLNVCLKNLTDSTLDVKQPEPEQD